MIKNKYLPPCYDCEDRNSTCHANCQSYNQWLKINKQLRKRRLELVRQKRWRLEK